MMNYTNNELLKIGKHARSFKNRKNLETSKWFKSLNGIKYIVLKTPNDRWSAFFFSETTEDTIKLMQARFPFTNI
jgi:hypothetical protein